MILFPHIKNCRNCLICIYKKIKPKGKVYIFIDEIQNIEGWEKFVNSYSQDYLNDYEIFITGSNSKMQFYLGI